MDLPSTLNAPRKCYIAGRVYWVRALSLEALGIIMAWLDDVLPGKAERTMPPPIGDEASQKALMSSAGTSLLTWLALRESGVSYEESMMLAFHPDLFDLETEEGQVRQLEHLCMLDILFRRRRTLVPSPGGRDISETWCAEGMAELSSTLGLEAVRGLSLDQYEWLASSGKVDGHASPQAMGYQAAVDQFNRDREAWLEQQKNGEVVTNA